MHVATRAFIWSRRALWLYYNDIHVLSGDKHHRIQSNMHKSPEFTYVTSQRVKLSKPLRADSSMPEPCTTGPGLNPTRYSKARSKHLKPHKHKAEIFSAPTSGISCLRFPCVLCRVGLGLALAPYAGSNSHHSLASRTCIHPMNTSRAVKLWSWHVTCIWTILFFSNYI
jgi:hypothetical protein